MSKFKPGDTVIRINSDNGYPQYAARGQVATVKSVHGIWVTVSYTFGSVDRLEDWAIDNVGLHDPKSAPAANPEPAVDLKWTELNGESTRIYHFPDGATFTVERVVRLCARPTNHRLETADGRKFIVPGKFIAVEVVADKWSA